MKEKDKHEKMKENLKKVSAKNTYVRLKCEFKDLKKLSRWYIIYITSDFKCLKSTMFSYKFKQTLLNIYATKKFY